MVRSYAPYDRKKQSGDAGKKKERRERKSNEWDIRIDCTPEYAQVIQDNLLNSKHVVDYALVSGIEKADSEALTTGSKENHVHIALITRYDMRRDQALALCRGLRACTEEYAVPRNKKFTYAGWFMHHTKADYKLVQEPHLRLEFGVLPEDEDNEYNRAAIKRLFNKFGSDSLEQSSKNIVRFNKFLKD